MHASPHCERQARALRQDSKTVQSPSARGGSTGAALRLVVHAALYGRHQAREEALPELYYQPRVLRFLASLIGKLSPAQLAAALTAASVS